MNARAIVKARRAHGDAVAPEINARKKKHVVFGAAGTLFVVSLLVGRDVRSLA